MTVVNIVVLSLTGLCALGALFFVLRGVQTRLAQSRQPYGVARQETRHAMQVSFLRAGFLFIVMLILLGVYGLIPGDETVDDASAPTPTARPAQTIDTPTIQVTTVPPSPAPSSPTPESTDIVATQTPTPTITITITITPPTPATPLTATVNSPNGLWLRDRPGGTLEVELIAHLAELTLLDGRETVDDLEWQQVRTAAGNEGWVAAEFLVLP